MDETWNNIMLSGKKKRCLFPGGSDSKESACNATWVRWLGWEDPREKGMATHSSILAWSILWTEEPGGLLSLGSQRVRHDWWSNTFTFKWKKATQKIIYFMIPFLINIQNKQIHRDKSKTGSYQRQWEGRARNNHIICMRFPLGVMKTAQNIVQNLNATESVHFTMVHFLLLSPQGT